MAEEKKNKEKEETAVKQREDIELNGGGVWTKDYSTILGRGGCATVYLGISPSVLHPESSIHPPLIAVKSVPAWSDDHQLLLEESEIFMELKPSPYIVQFFGESLSVDNEGNEFFNLCFELALGGSLRDRIRSSNGGLDDEMDVRCCTRSILKGLGHIHDQGFVHCDLKPHNILLCENNVPKIADFGLAVKRDRLPRIRNTLYRGTHLYVAPEEIHYQSYHPISDIWGLGCTVLEMLTGSYPWGFDPEMNDRKSIIRYIAATEELPIIPEHISPLAKDFLSHCLVRDTDLRWTVDMLMEHPFIYSIDQEIYIKEVLQKEEMEEIENKKKRKREAKEEEEMKREEMEEIENKKKRKREADEEEAASKKMKICNHGIRRRRCAALNIVIV